MINKCNCETCQDLRHLREKGVSEDFINRWVNEGEKAAVKASILDGSWPTSVEHLEAALENAKSIRDE